MDEVEGEGVTGERQRRLSGTQPRGGPLLPSSYRHYHPPSGGGDKTGSQRNPSPNRNARLPPNLPDRLQQRETPGIYN